MQRSRLRRAAHLDAPNSSVMCPGDGRLLQLGGWSRSGGPEYPGNDPSGLPPVSPPLSKIFCHIWAVLNVSKSDPSFSATTF